MNFDFSPYVRWASKSTYLLNHTACSYDCHILYIISGNGTYYCNDSSYNLSSNTLIYYPYGTACLAMPYENSELLFYTINFDFDMQNTHLPCLHPVPLQKYKPDNTIFSIPTGLKNVFSKPMYIPNSYWAKSYLDTICNEFLTRQEDYVEVESSLLKVLLINLYRRHFSYSSSNKLCDEIKSLVSKNLKLNNKEIANILNYNSFYINDVFKKHENITLHRYITQTRLAMAYQLIMQSKMSLEDIAEECGFSSQAHLSYVFKKNYSITPSQLRK